jgi:hypothetical protein
MSSLKRPLSAIDEELAEVGRLERELQHRAKRLRQERDAHEDHEERVRLREREALMLELPPYLFDALVRTPLDAKNYGALRSYSIEFAPNSREIKDGIFADELLIVACFEKKTIAYSRDTSNGDHESHAIDIPTSLKKDRPRITQQQLWERALCLNLDDTGLAFIVLCNDCYQLIDDFEDACVDAPLRDVETYRRIQCKTPLVTESDLRELYDLEMFAWLKAARADDTDFASRVLRVNQELDVLAQ